MIRSSRAPTGPHRLRLSGRLAPDGAGRIGGFDPAFAKNEDYELSWRLRRRGGEVWFDPALSVLYRPRSTLRALARQYFEYGLWKAVMLATHPASLRVRQVAAPLLVLGLAASAALAAAGAPGASVLPLGYLAILAAGTLEALLRRRGSRGAVLVPAVLATMHVAWGVGFLSSLARGPRWLLAGRRKTRAVRTLILNSTWVPDPSSTGQHFHDVAAALAGRGHEVLALTANRGYENPAERYPSRERRDGVVIRRLLLSSFGKNSIVARVVGGLSFVTQAAVHGLLSRRPDVVLVSTAPPFCSAAALAVSWLRGVPFLFWVHDLNPDLTIALGLTRERRMGGRTYTPSHT